MGESAIVANYRSCEGNGGLFRYPVSGGRSEPPVPSGYKSSSGIYSEACTFFGRIDWRPVMMAGLRGLPSLVLGGLGDLLGRFFEPSAFREPTLASFSFEKVLFK